MKLVLTRGQAAKRLIEEKLVEAFEMSSPLSFIRRTYLPLADDASGCAQATVSAGPTDSEKGAVEKLM